MGHRLPAGKPGRSVARQRHDCAEAAFVVKALMDAAPGGEAMPAGLFEAAACCDAALAGLLTGDLREAARVLKALYVAGRWPVICWVVGVAGPPLPNLPRGPLLDDAQMTALRERAGVLAASPLPESWVGDELLDLWQPGCPLCRAQPGSVSGEGEAAAVAAAGGEGGLGVLDELAVGGAAPDAGEQDG